MIKLNKIMIILLIIIFPLIILGCSSLDTGQYTLDVNIDGEGLLYNGNRILDTDENIQYEKNSVITLSPQSNDGWVFDKWEGDNSGELIHDGNNSWKITLNDNKEITAVFKNEDYISYDSTTFADLSDGDGSLTIDNFKEDEYVLATIYSSEDKGRTNWNVGSMGTGITGISENIIYEGPDSDAYNMQEDTANTYLREIEADILLSHSQNNNVSGLASFLKNEQIYQVGDKRSFNVYSGSGQYNEQDAFNKVNASLKAVGDHSLFWVDDAIDVSSRDIDRMKSEFEETIHSRITDIFGREPTADNFDILQYNGEKVNILITPLTWCGGYFWATDLYPVSSFPYSNESKIFYIKHYNFDALDYQISTIAHEFQHMIFYNEKTLSNKPNGSGPSIWINEGFSHLAKDMAGYGYLRYGYNSGSYGNGVEAYLTNINNTSLIHWGGQSADYGASYLFARYIYDRFGEGIIEYIHTSKEGYMEAIAEYAGISFRQLYEDWTLALILDSFSNVKDEKYKFKSIDIPFPESSYTVLEPGQNWSNKSLKGWSSIFTIIQSGNGSDLNINVEDAEFDGDMYIKLYRGNI
ncbi:MAG: InlB B-repeat-containing protein [Bacillota bacterium]